MSSPYKRKLLASCISCASALTVMAGNSLAQEGQIEEVLVTGIKGSLQAAQDIKRDAVGVMDAISAEGLGKFPDSNIAETLQRIPGIAIDRNGGEGQFVTVRGFGPSFNTVLVNGRRIVSETGGREFSFDLYPAELISGAEIFKSGTAHLAEGGIGATINLKTARPLDMSEDKALINVKALYDNDSEETTPQVFGLYSKVINDGKTGFLVSLSYQERDSQEDFDWQNGWLVNDVANIDLLDANSNPGNVDQAFIPREVQTGRRNQTRTRKNFQGVFQHDINDQLRFTADGFYNDYEVESTATMLGSWFGSTEAISNVVLDSNGTVLEEDISSEVGILNRLEGRPTKTKAIGFNLEWSPTSELTSSFDLSYSKSEAKQGTGNGQAVIGFQENEFILDENGNEIPNPVYEDYIFHFTNAGSVSEIIYPQIIKDRVSNRENMLSHVAQFGDQAGDGTGGNSVDGNITEFKWDNKYIPDNGGMLDMVRFGISYSEEEKTVDVIRPPVEVFCLYCFFTVPVPDELLLDFATDGLFSGVAPNTFRDIFTFNLADYIAWQSSPEGFASLDACWADLSCSPTIDLPAEFDPAQGGSGGYAAYYASLPGGFIGTRQPDSYVVKESLFSAYTDVTLRGEDFLGANMGWVLNAGLRWVRTKDEAEGSQQELIALTQGTPTQYTPSYSSSGSGFQSETNDYWTVLPNLALTLNVTEELVLRAAVSETMTRPELSDIAPRFSYGDLRPGAINATAGNVNLEPYTSINFDLSAEYYWGDINYVSVAFFSKQVQNFIVAGVQKEVQTGVNIHDIDVPDPAIDEENGTVTPDVLRPRNSETAEVSGWEIAAQYQFPFGLGFTANSTTLDSNAQISSNSDVSTLFAIPGLGDSLNASVFYEAGPIEARVSWSWRDAFLEELINPKAGQEPVFTEEFEQTDFRLTYNINEDLSVYLEGANIFDEKIRKHGRYDNQFILYRSTGPRYGLGVRAQF